MAACQECGQEMMLGVGCTLRRYDIEGASYDRTPNGEDSCHDCKAPPFTLHHPGCDSERCPRCGGQFIGCDCDEDDWPDPRLDEDE